jgi:hypothetical protein
MTTSSLINYTALQTTAMTLISSLGASYKLMRPNVNGTDTRLAITSGTMDKQVAEMFSSGGGVIAYEKKVIYLPCINFGKVEPQVEDRLIPVVNPLNTGYRIIEIDVLRPDGKTAILYTCTIA